MFTYYNIKLLVINRIEQMLESNEQTKTLATLENNVNKSNYSLKHKKMPKNIKLNYWSVKQQIIYLNYLKQHMPMITYPQYRKDHRVFKKISDLLGTRSPIQVKSHHQKLEDKYKNISKIIAHLEKELQPQKFEEEVLKRNSIDSEVRMQFDEFNIAPLQSFLQDFFFFQMEFIEKPIRICFLTEQDQIAY